MPRNETQELEIFRKDHDETWVEFERRAVREIHSLKKEITLLTSERDKAQTRVKKLEDLNECR